MKDESCALAYMCVYVLEALTVLLWSEKNFICIQSFPSKGLFGIKATVDRATSGPVFSREGWGEG